MLRNVLTARSGGSAPSYIARTEPIGSALCGFGAARSPWQPMALTRRMASLPRLGQDAGRSVGLGSGVGTDQPHPAIAGDVADRPCANSDVEGRRVRRAVSIVMNGTDARTWGSATASRPHRRDASLD